MIRLVRWLTSKSFFQSCFRYLNDQGLLGKFFDQKLEWI